MSNIYRNRSVGNKRGVSEQTTEEQVRDALADDAQRDALMRRTNRTVGAMRTLIGRDPREMAYVLMAMENKIDAFSGHLDITDLLAWASAATAILRTHPQVRAFNDCADRASMGRLLYALRPVGSEATDAV